MSVCSYGEAGSEIVAGTHTRRAQPVLWPHYLLAYFEMFARDLERFKRRETRDVMRWAGRWRVGFPTWTAKRLRTVLRLPGIRWTFRAIAISRWISCMRLR